MKNAVRWWGYRHVNGSLHVKRYIGAFAEDAMDDAVQSPFVERVVGPIVAASKQEAMAEVKARLAPRPLRGLVDPA